MVAEDVASTFLTTAKIMKSSGFRSFDAVAGAFFVALGIGGVLFFDWGELRLAFLLLIYVLLIIGFRLDEISRRLAAIDRRLALQYQRQVELDAASFSSEAPPPSPSVKSQ
ncbi:MAG: hypothetical protein WCZ16_02790 [Desulfosarcinaceae bacterium]